MLHGTLKSVLCDFLETVSHVTNKDVVNYDRVVKKDIKCEKECDVAECSERTRGTETFRSRGDTKSRKQKDKNRRRRHAARHRVRDQDSSTSLATRQAVDKYHLEIQLHEQEWNKKFSLQEQRQRHDIERRHDEYLKLLRKSK